VRRATLGLLAVLLLTAILLAEIPFERRALTVGQTSPQDFTVPSERTVKDEAATGAARDRAAAAVEPVYRTDAAANSAMVKQVTELFDAAENAAKPPTPPSTQPPATQPGETTLPPAPPPAPSPDQRYATLRQMYPAYDRSNADGLKAVSSLEAAELADVRQTVVRLLQQTIQHPIRDSDLGAARDDLSLAISAVTPSLSPELARLFTAFLSNVLRPNLVVDQDATEARRADAAGRIPSVEVVYQRGQVIAHRGDRLTEEQVALLREFDLGNEPRGPRIVTSALVAMVLVSVSALWLRSARPLLWGSPRRLLMALALFAGYSSVAVVLTSVARTGNPAWGYLIPSATLGLLSCILLDSPTAVFLALAAGLVAGVASHGNFAYAGFAATAGLVPLPFVSQLSARGQLLAATWRTAIGVCLMAGVFSYGASVSSREVVSALVAGAANGLLSGLLAIGLLPFFESLFDVVTPTRLLDLTDRNHPLLRELEEKAIGTYNHSILVGTLAERAARRIGANGLLCRAAAYYHDIGKTRRPYFFVENQLSGDNPHDRITPAVSAMIIKDHVTDGIELARRYRIPREVAEGILTHHGTGRIQYFLSKAAVEGQVLDEDLFRHVGHAPRTKETAILMIADSCEGASRALAQSEAHTLTPEKVSELVDRIVDQKVEDGQLDECDLTFADLSEIRASLSETLIGVYHPRIEYPPMPEPPPDGEGSDRERTKGLRLSLPRRRSPRPVL
jgi:cyclic-di-AMP phosphodiesterase PgpH